MTSADEFAGVVFFSKKHLTNRQKGDIIRLNEQMFAFGKKGVYCEMTLILRAFCRILRRLFRIFFKASGEQMFIQDNICNGIDPAEVDAN